MRCLISRFRRFKDCQFLAFGLLGCAECRYAFRREARLCFAILATPVLLRPAATPVDAWCQLADTQPPWG